MDCNDDYYLLGILEAKAYDVNEPIAAAEQAIRFWPKAPEPYCLLATLYERAGDVTKAVTYARQYLDFPAADRFPQCEPDAKRILGLGDSGSGGGPTMVTTTAVPSGSSTPTPIRIEAGASGTPVASGIANCIDFRESSTCAPF